MKTSRKEINLDPCITSVDMLEKRSRKYLSEKLGLANLWFTDHSSGTNSKQLKNISNDEAINTVLFGDFFRRFFESGNWPFDNYKIWLLSHSCKRVMENLFHIESDKIGVIPRYELFPHSKAEVPNPNEKIELIYSGRISATKNIEFICAITSYLQTSENLNVSLRIFGHYDDEFHENYGRRIHKNYQEKLENFISTLSWSEKPIFEGRKKPDEWVMGNFKQPVLINMSNYFCEDYGVAVAQAQEKGWPVLLSEWGGHLDVTKGVRSFINPSFIGHSHEHTSVIKTKAKIVAEVIANNIQNKDWLTQDTHVNPSVEITEISYDELSVLRREQVKKIGLETPLINREKMDEFSDSDLGALYVKSYEKHFGPQNIDSTIVYVAYDLDDETNSFDINNYEKLNNHLREFKYSDNDKIEILSSKDLFLKKNSALLMRANKVFVTFSVSQHENIKKHLLGFAGDRVEFL